MEGYCFTNIDRFQNETWPEKFVALPRIGDKVQSNNGVVLKICAITHYQTTLATGNLPKVKIELTDPNPDAFRRSWHGIT